MANVFTREEFEQGRSRTTKLRVSVLLIVTVLLTGSIVWYRQTHSDSAVAGNITHTYLYGLSSPKTNPRALRNLSTAALNVATPDSELHGLQGPEQHITALHIDQVFKSQADIMAVTGTITRTLPGHSDKSTDTVKSDFSLRLIKEENAWKVDSFLVN